MRVIEPDLSVAKGWFAGPWDSDLDISVGYANAAINEPHFHRRMTEIYFFARGEATMLIDGRELRFKEKSCVIIDPGEVHTFLSCSADHYHFVIQTPGLQDEEAKSDKVLVEVKC